VIWNETPLYGPWAAGVWRDNGWLAKPALGIAPTADRDASTKQPATTTNDHAKASRSRLQQMHAQGE
jgi:hypothetical protein